MYSSPCTIQIRLSWQDVAMNKAVSFEPGDQLGILPQNGDDMVLKLIQRLDPVPSLEQTYRLKTLNEISTIAGNISSIDACTSALFCYVIS